jgi:hypothetical protein
MQAVLPLMRPLMQQQLLPQQQVQAARVVTLVVMVVSLLGLMQCLRGASRSLGRYGRPCLGTSAQG